MPLAVEQIVYIAARHAPPGAQMRYFARASAGDLPLLNSHVASLPPDQEVYFFLYRTRSALESGGAQPGTFLVVIGPTGRVLLKATADPDRVVEVEGQDAVAEGKSD